jgi:hypothetical protein
MTIYYLIHLQKFKNMTIEDRKKAFVALGDMIRHELAENKEELDTIIIKAKVHNPWFDPRFTRIAFQSIADWLTVDRLNAWVNNYDKSYFQESEVKVGVIMAGNIPMVGFHDFLSVLISGKVFKGKLSSQDEFLLPFLADKLISIEPAFEAKIEFVPHLLKDFDAVIATGSNNSARYFDYYFGKYPHIIRKNRNSVAVITGNETKEELENLADDVYQYFGLGCRSVSKVFVPTGYSIPHLLDHFQHYVFLHEHTKYFNNYEYNKSIFLLNKIPHFDNGFHLLTQNDKYASPVSVLYYEEYDDLEVLERRLMVENEQLQCIIGGDELNILHEKFGNSQYPTLSEYADNVDIISFLGGLS